jgi:hypothetical protein
MLERFLMCWAEGEPLKGFGISGRPLVTRLKPVKMKSRILQKGILEFHTNPKAGCESEAHPQFSGALSSHQTSSHQTLDIRPGF